MIGEQLLGEFDVFQTDGPQVDALVVEGKWVHTIAASAPLMCDQATCVGAQSRI